MGAACSRVEHALHDCSPGRPLKSAKLSHITATIRSRCYCNHGPVWNRGAQRSYPVAQRGSVGGKLALHDGSIQVRLALNRQKTQGTSAQIKVSAKTWETLKPSFCAYTCPVMIYLSVYSTSGDSPARSLIASARRTGFRVQFTAKGVAGVAVEWLFRSGLVLCQGPPGR